MMLNLIRGKFKNHLLDLILFWRLYTSIVWIVVTFCQQNGVLI